MSKSTIENTNNESWKKSPHRRWCFTLYPEKLHGARKNAKTKTLAKQAMNVIREKTPHLRGVFFSIEKGDSKEHTHIQGYMELARPARFRQLTERLGMGVHLEPASGDRDENHDYIYHEGKHKDKGELLCTLEWGEWPSATGNETGAYSQAINLVLEGVSISYIARTLGGSILPQVGNLVRLRKQIEEEAEINIAYIRNSGIGKDEWLRFQRNNEEIAF